MNEVPPDTTVTRDTDASDLSTIAIPGYRVLRKIGEGGMGEVYEAEQLDPVRRRVALKLLKAGMDTKQVLARFEAERQALALMNHAYIAQVYDAGATDRGRSYFAMEFVRGLPVTDYCDRQCLSIRERLDLFVRVCEGVQHAHQKGIIHRDLKPSNVLVAVEDDEVKPKIIDFGLARATDRRLTEQTLVTQLGAIVGTPEYMSPEQAELTPLDIDTRSDVYSLGVLLHVLLVGALPFDARGLRECGSEEMRRRIREEEPKSPSSRVNPTKARELRGDLDWIVMKALEKDRTRRYSSAVELAADIRRHLNDEPVVAGPPGAAYRLVKFARRHRTGVITGSLMLLALVAGAVAATYGMVRAVRAEAAAREEAATASEVSDFLVGLFQISDPGTSRGNTITAREILDRGAERVRRDLADQPLVQSRMLAAVGAVYRGLGLYSEAEDLLRRALAIREEQLDPEDPVILDNLFDLGWTLALDGRPEEVLELAERLLPAAERVYAPGDPRLARVLAGMAEIRFAQGMPVEAETLARRALTIWEDRLDAPYPFRAHAMDLLGRILASRGETEESLALLEAAEVYRRDVLGPDHPDMARSALARARARPGNAEDSSGRLADLQEALRIREEILGPDHPELVEILEQLAYFYDGRGDHGTAREYYERSIGIATEANPHHEVLIDLLMSYAVLRGRDGEVESVVELYERTLEIIERNGGIDHPQYAVATHNLGDFLFGTGSPADAAAYFEKSLAAREKHLPPDDEQLGWTLHGLAQCWRQTDRAAEAEPLYRRALRIIEGVHGLDSGLTALVVENLAASLNRQGKLVEARPYWDRARGIVEQNLGPDHQRMIGPLYGTANLHYLAGDHAEAIPFHKRALEIQEALLGRDHRFVMTSYYNLGCLHALAGMRKEAMTYLNQSLDRGFDWPGALEDVDLASLRGDPAFESFAAEVRRRNGQ